MLLPAWYTNVLGVGPLITMRNAVGLNGHGVMSFICPPKGFDVENALLNDTGASKKTTAKNKAKKHLYILTDNCIT